VRREQSFVGFVRSFELPGGCTIQYLLPSSKMHIIGCGRAETTEHHCCLKLYASRVGPALRSAGRSRASLLCSRIHPMSKLQGFSWLASLSLKQRRRPTYCTSEAAQHFRFPGMVITKPVNQSKRRSTPSHRPNTESPTDKFTRVT
jgi:hypothetical protein